MLTKINTSDDFAKRLHAELRADIDRQAEKEVAGQHLTRVRVEKGGLAVVCAIIEMGSDYMLVSDGGHLRFLQFSGLTSVQFVTDDPSFLEATRVPFNGYVKA